MVEHRASFQLWLLVEEILIRNPNTKIHYVGSIFGSESKVFPIKDVWHTLLPIRGLQRDLSLQSIFRNLLLPFRILQSYYKTNNLINDFKPDIIVGTGGYASALPLMVVPFSKKIFLLFFKNNYFLESPHKMVFKESYKNLRSFSRSVFRIR